MAAVPSLGQPEAAGERASEQPHPSPSGDSAAFNSFSKAGRGKEEDFLIKNTLNTPPSSVFFPRMGKIEQRGEAWEGERWRILGISSRRCGKGSAVGAPSPVETSGISSRAGERRETFIPAEGEKKRERAIEHIIKGLHKDGARAGGGKIGISRNEAQERFQQPRHGGVLQPAWLEIKHKAHEGKKNGGVWSGRCGIKELIPPPGSAAKRCHCTSTHLSSFCCNELSDQDYLILFAASLTGVWFVRSFLLLFFLLFGSVYFFLVSFFFFSSFN